MDTISPNQLNKIHAMIKEVEKLGDVEKLFLYLNLPCGKLGSVDTGKTKSINRLRLHQNTSKHQLTSSSSSSSSRPSSPPLSSSQQPASHVTFKDFQKQLEQMPRRSDQETTQTYTWILSHLEVDPNVSLPKQEVYEEYKTFCQMNQFEPLCVADFGKAMKYAFPCIKPRRLGQRGNSRYCYSGLRKKYKLESPNLPCMEFCESNNQDQHHLLSIQNSNLVNIDATTTSNATTTIIGSTHKINDEQLPIVKNDTNDNELSMHNNTNMNVSCIKQVDLNACNLSVPLAPSDQVLVQNGCAQQKTKDIVCTSPIVTNCNNAYTSPTTTLDTLSSSQSNSTISTRYNEINDQYNSQRTPIFNQNPGTRQMNQRDSLLTPIDFENIYNNNNDNSNNNSINSTPDFNTNSQPITSQQNNVTTSLSIRDHQLQSRSCYGSPMSHSSYQSRRSIVSQADFVEGTSMVGATSYPIPRSGTPDDDEYSHNYNNYMFNNYQNQQVNFPVDINARVPQQQHQPRPDFCNNININYASNFRCQQNFINQSHQHENDHHQRHANNNNNSDNNNNNNNNIDDNNNQQQYHQQQDQQHHITTGSSVDADPALPDGGDGPHFNSNNDNNMNCVDNSNYVSTSNKFTDSPINSYVNNNFVPKRERNDPIPFKQNDQQQKQQHQQVVINQAIPLNMFTLDTCLSSPFQSPASTPYPSHMMVATTPNYEPATDELDSFTSHQKCILSSRSSTPNHYMTT